MAFFKDFPVEVWEMTGGSVLGSRVYHVVDGGFKDSFTHRHGANELLLVIQSMWMEINSEGEEDLKYCTNWMLRSLPGLMVANKQHWDNGKCQFFGPSQFKIRDADGILAVLPRCRFQQCQHIGIGVLYKRYPDRQHGLKLLEHFEKLREVSIIIGYDGSGWITDYSDLTRDSICDFHDYVLSLRPMRFLFYLSLSKQGDNLNCTHPLKKQHWMSVKCYHGILDPEFLTHLD